MAVKVTFVPEHIVVAEPAILILTGRFGLTTIVTVLDVAGLPVAQVALDVNWHVIVFPFASELLLYVVLFVPTLDPLSFH